jgi:hypothetical protein
MVRHVRVVPSTAFQSLIRQSTAEFAEHVAATLGALLPVALLPENTTPTPPLLPYTVADMPQFRVAEDGLFSVTVMPVAVAPTTPVHKYAADWFRPPVFWLAREVHVTDPPDADGVTVTAWFAVSAEAFTTMMSPAATSNAVVVNDAGPLL